MIELWLKFDIGVDRDGHHFFVQEQANNFFSKKEISDVVDTESKLPRPQLPGANNLEEVVQHMDDGSGSSILHCAGSVGFTGSSKTLPLPPAEPDYDLPTTRNKAWKACSDSSSGEESSCSEKNGAAGDSNSSGHGSDGGGGACLRSKLLLPLPGLSTAPNIRSSTIANAEPEITSVAGNGESRGAGKEE